MRKIILLVVILISVVYFWNQRGNEVPQVENEEVTEEEITETSKLVGFEVDEPVSQGQNPETHLVSYTEDGYSPESITIKVGDTVVFENEGTGRMWTATDFHPDHTIYNDSHRTSLCDQNLGNPEVFDQCGVGQSYAFTFNKVGEWGYHNHVQASHLGKIIVQ